MRMNWRAVLAGVVTAGLGFLLINKRAEAKSATPSPAAPKPPTPKPSASKPPMNLTPPAMNATHLQSLPANTVERYDRLTLKSGKRFTLAPLWDTLNNTWARADYDHGLLALAPKGLRYPTFAELDEIASRPDTLITPLCNQPPTDQMATREWWEKFDLCIQAALDIAGWDGTTPVFFGKSWAHGANTFTDKGQPASWLHGFYTPKGKQPGGGYSTIVQNRGKTAHDRGHVDYSQLLYGVEL